MLQRLLSILVLATGFIAIWGTAGLAFEEYRAGPICPSVLGIPACYVVLLFFVLAICAHIIPTRKSARIFFILVLAVTIIAVVGTIGEVSGTLQCPRTANGIPMCYILLVLCAILLLAKWKFERTLD